MTERIARLPAVVRRLGRRAGRTGIDHDTYQRMFAAQGGGCAICGAAPKTRKLHVDHSHATGAIRGLLCFTCNRLVAVARTWNDARVEAAREYLRHGPREDGTPWLG